MRAVYKQPCHVPEVIDVQNELEPLKTLVGGYIETVYLGEGYILICNEEGKLWGLEPNIFLISGTNVDEVVGPILIVKDAGEEFGELTEEETEVVCERLGGSGIWQM